MDENIDNSKERMKQFLFPKSDITYNALWALLLHVPAAVVVTLIMIHERSIVCLGLLLFVVAEGLSYAGSAALDINSAKKFDPSEEQLEDFKQAQSFFNDMAKVGSKYLFVYSEREFISLDECTKIEVINIPREKRFCISFSTEKISVSVTFNYDKKDILKRDYSSFEDAILKANPQLKKVLKKTRTKLKETSKL